MVSSIEPTTSFAAIIADLYIHIILSDIPEGSLYFGYLDFR